MRVLSVDLGTSNTAAVLAAHGRPPRVVEVDGSATMPSAVFAGEDGSLVAGRDAERWARLDPSRFEPHPKRRLDEGSLLLGEAIIMVPDALGAVFGRIAEETSRQLAGNRPDEVRLTHPAQWGPVRRDILLSAARLGGFGSNLVLVPEPVAAAAHFATFPGQALAFGQALAVYDLGAGTFDCAVVGATEHGLAVLAENGLSDLGGLDVDQALLEHVGREVAYRDPGAWQRLLRPESTADRRAQRTLREDVRAAKETLSRHQQTEVPMPAPFADVLVTRAELEALIRPNLLRSTDLLAATIRSTGVTPANLAGVYLVGGASRIPLVGNLIAEQLRIVAISLDQPETAVALGAHGVPRDGFRTRTQNVSRPFSPVTGFAPPSFGPVRSHRKRRLLIGVIALTILALVGGILWFGHRGGGPAVAACQQNATPDAQGFTPCLRQLAGAVPEHGQCQPGLGGIGAAPAGLAGTTVTCQLGGETSGYSVMYMQAGATADAVTRALGTLLPRATGERVEADWQGGGLRGHYRASVDSGVGVLVFTVRNSPAFGVLTGVQLGSGDLTAGQLADYFEQHVRPGG